MCRNISRKYRLYINTYVKGYLTITVIPSKRN
jgi:hypothetical protein